MKTRQTLPIPPARDRQLKKLANQRYYEGGWYDPDIYDEILARLRRAELNRMRKERK